MAEFKHPNQQGGQDGQTLMAMLVVVVAIVLGIQFFHAKTSPPPSSSATAAAPQAHSPSPPQAGPAAPLAAASKSAAVKSAKSTAPSVEASAESSTVVENDVYRITFSNRGAQVTSWILKNYKDLDGHPLDLVHPHAAKLFGYPLSLYTSDGSKTSIADVSRNGDLVTLTTSGDLPADIDGRAVEIAGVSDSSFDGAFIVHETAPNTLTYRQDFGSNSSSTGGTFSSLNGSTGEKLNQALFVASATGPLDAPASLTFRYSSDGLQATKTFAFDAKTYVLHATVTVTRDGAPVHAQLSWPGGFGDQNEDLHGSNYSNSKFDIDRNGAVEHTEPKKVVAGDTLNGPFDWAGVSDPYFAATFLPDSPATATVTTTEGQIDVAKTILRAGFGSSPTKALNMPILGASLGDIGGTVRTRIFAGPKAMNVLRSVHAANAAITLEPVLSFGFWGFIGKYLFLGLLFIHSYIGVNWGWAIIILTVFITLLMLPFKVMSMKSALKMQRIQPQMDAVKEKYKKYKTTDPKRGEMNAEIMKLQKDNGVNMFGGCIPSLITFPFLMAFFYMLRDVPELRLAHWYWLPNLQAPDPYHILPILMVISQFLVQFYTPSPGVDPQQQKMMAFLMPAFSGYICWTYASGLALYWSVSNLIGIAQQAVINSTSLGREMREIAAKRARRKASSKAITIKGRK